MAGSDGAVCSMPFTIAPGQSAATALRAHLHEAGNGRIVWLDAED